MSQAKKFGLDTIRPVDRERRNRVMGVLAERGMTMTSLASAIGVSRPYISDIISGRKRYDSAERRIAGYLHMNADWLFPRRTLRELLAMQQAERRTEAA